MGFILGPQGPRVPRGSPQDPCSHPRRPEAFFWVPQKDDIDNCEFTDEELQADFNLDKNPLPEDGVDLMDAPSRLEDLFANPLSKQKKKTVKKKKAAVKGKKAVTKVKKKVPAKKTKSVKKAVKKTAAKTSATKKTTKKKVPKKSSSTKK